MRSEALTRLIAEFRGANREPDRTIAQLRDGFDQLAANKFLVPSDVSITPVDAGGVAGEWVSPPAPACGVVLFFHGGGYCMGSPKTHRGLTGRLALASNRRVLSLDYRLAPEHPFPAAIDDCVAAYRWLLDGGTSPHDIALAGDSAGGGLVLCLLLALKQQNLPLPATCACLSPLTDHVKSGDSVRLRADRDPLLTPASTTANSDRYVTPEQARDPLASPLYGDLSGLPPTLILVGSEEILFDDSSRVAAKAQEAGSPVELDVWEGLFHVWPLFADDLPEGQEAIDRAAAYIREHLAAR